MTTTETSITPELYAQLKDCDSVLVREYARSDGSRFAKVIAAGTSDEMDSLAGTPGLLLVLSGVEYIGDMVVPVGELLPPDETEVE